MTIKLRKITVDDVNVAHEAYTIDHVAGTRHIFTDSDLVAGAMERGEFWGLSIWVTPKNFAGVAGIAKGNATGYKTLKGYLRSKQGQALLQKALDELQHELEIYAQLLSRFVEE